MKKLHAKAVTKNGLSLFFDSYRFNQIDNHGSSTIHSQLANQYQNLKSFVFVVLNNVRGAVSDLNCGNSCGGAAGCVCFLCIDNQRNGG